MKHRIEPGPAPLSERLSALAHRARGVPPALWIIALSGWLAIVCTATVDPGSDWTVVRATVVFSFVLFTPGWAVVLHLPLQSALEKAVTAVGLSISSLLLVSVGFTLAHNPSTEARLVTLAVLTTLVSAAAAYRQIRTPAGQEVALR